MRVELTFMFSESTPFRLVRVDEVKDIGVQDYVFNGQLRPEKALVVNGTAWELRHISDIRLTVHTT